MIFVMLSPLLIIGFIALSIMEERKRKTEQKKNLKRKRIKFQILIMTTTKLNKSLVMKGEQYESIHRGR